MELPEPIKEAADYVMTYAGLTTTDWFKIKREIINRLPPKYRNLFSKRHYSSKKHILNEYDRKVISYWEEKMGVKVFIDESKLHPKDWNPKPRGWGLWEINRRRKKEAHERRQQQQKIA